ncbi:MAG: hypothetical protein U0W40_04780 [Acidimicrobiia bacterium]
MRRTQRIGSALVVALAIGTTTAAAIAGPASAAAKPTTATVISVQTTDGQAGVLTAGTTAVYTLSGTGTCSGKCLTARPPVLLPKGVKAATAGPGVDAASLGTAKAAHNRRQVTYGGKRLYWSAKDSSVSAVHDGKDKFGTWSTVTIAAATTTTTPAPATEAPTTQPTTAPQTAPAETAPPATDPPATDPPTTPPAPRTDPPTKTPGSGGAAF